MGSPHRIVHFITFTTYGTWLHGDMRGSVDRKGQTHRERFLPHDPLLEYANRRRMKHPPVTLDAPRRGCVRKAIREDCEHRGRPITALNVRTNHVHLIVSTTDSADKVLQQVKAWATRKLREEGLIEPGRPVWTEGGDRKELKDQKALEEARYYVNERQGPPLPEA